MSKDRFKIYFQHIDDEAHLVSEKSFKKCEIVIQKELDALNEIDKKAMNKILNDIDKFVLDQEYSDQNIQ